MRVYQVDELGETRMGQLGNTKLTQTDSSTEQGSEHGLMAGRKLVFDVADDPSKPDGHKWTAVFERFPLFGKKYSELSDYGCPVGVILLLGS